MLATTDEEFNILMDIEVKAKVNGDDIRILNQNELKILEPELNVENVLAALYSPEEFLVDPFLMVLSNLYVALHYGCQLKTRCRVVNLKIDEGFPKRFYIILFKVDFFSTPIFDYRIRAYRTPLLIE